MELVKVSSQSTDLFPQHDFVLFDRGRKLCQLTAVETSKGRKLDISVVTAPEYRYQGYASYSIKMLIQWAIKNGYKAVTLTNFFEFKAIDKIAKRLNFDRKPHSWIKPITGRHF